MASSVMRKVSLRSLAAHKLRLVLTVFSVVLGTTFVAAAMIFTASVQGAFNNIFDNVARGVAAEVTATDAQSPGVPVTVVDELKAKKDQLGIDRIQVAYGGSVTLAKKDGSGLQTGGAPSVGSAYVPPDQAVDSAGMKLVAGRAPQAEGEVVINSSAADKAGLKVGDKTVVALGAGTARPLEVTVVGLVDMPAATGGYVNVQFWEPQAQDLFSDGEYVASVDMSAVKGVSDTTLRDRVNALVNPKDPEHPKAEPVFKVRTGEQVRQDQKDAVGTFLNVFRYVLLAFAAIGLIVGTFIIYNTFSMIVAQRNRELALLRAIGASRKDIWRSVLLEAFVVGVIGGAIGLGAGIGIAALLQLLTSSSGVPSNGLQIGVSAILAAIFVGIVVTMASALFPALRASRIPPVEAMRMSAAEPGAGSLRKRTTVGVGFAAVGIVALILGIVFHGVAALLLIGAAALLLIIAVVLGAPALSQPVVGGIGRVLQIPFGTVGKLARTNAIRNPRRSAATAFALTIGLILVVIIGTIGASFKSTIDASIDKSLSADFVVRNASGEGMSAAVGEAVRKDVTDAKTIVAFDMTFAKLNDKQTVLATAIGGPLSDVLRVDTVKGSEDVGGHDLAISESAAKKYHWKLGSPVTFTSTTGQDVGVTVTGIYQDNQALGDWRIGNDAFDQLTPDQSQRRTVTVLVRGKSGSSMSALRKQIEDSVKPFLTPQVQDRQEFKNAFSSLIDSMMATLYALLGLALVVAVLGIINTLALSVVERRQEIGMLRAIGTSRAQLRRTIYLESTYIAVFGALLGVVLGLAIGLPLVHALKHWGIDSLSVPWSLIVITLVGSAVVGVIAALWPAISAARTKPLEAITE